MVRKAASQAGSSSASPEQASPLAFEDAISELESLVQRMESGSLSLEDSLAAYRRGAELVSHCRSALAAVQQQVRVLEGELLRPFEAGAEPSADDQ